VPRALVSNLPFKSQIAVQEPRAAPTYLPKRAVVLGAEEKEGRETCAKAGGEARRLPKES
jgi:ribosome biogenesis protein BMS1